MRTLLAKGIGIIPAGTRGLPLAPRIAAIVAEELLTELLGLERSTSSFGAEQIDERMIRKATRYLIIETIRDKFPHLGDVDPDDVYHIADLVWKKIA
jgi:hypothetical protein